MKLKKIYKDQLSLLKRSYDKQYLEQASENKKISEYIDLVNEMLTEIQNISKDQKTEPKTKYIKINEKTVEIEKLNDNLNNIYNQRNKKINNWKKEFMTLAENISEDNKIDINKVISELTMLMDNLEK
jgi:hypothetical protein